MAWDISTWVAGATVTAAQMNARIRDNFKAIGDPWTTYTPTVTGMSVGNGTLSARYVQAGKLVHLRLSLTAGGTTSYSGAVTFSLPSTAVASGGEQVGSAKLYTGTQDFAGVFVVGSGSSTGLIRVPTASGNVVLAQLSNTSLNTGTTGNFTVQITYEAA